MGKGAVSAGCGEQKYIAVGQPLAPQAIIQSMRYPGFSNPRLTGNENDLARRPLRPLPPPMLELELLSVCC
jgi:hypothetical protein